MLGLVALLSTSPESVLAQREASLNVRVTVLSVASAEPITPTDVFTSLGTSGATELPDTVLRIATNFESWSLNVQGNVQFDASTSDALAQLQTSVDSNSATPETESDAGDEQEVQGDGSAGLSVDINGADNLSVSQSGDAETDMDDIVPGVLRLEAWSESEQAWVRVGRNARTLARFIQGRGTSDITIRTRAVPLVEGLEQDIEVRIVLTYTLTG